MSGESIHNHSLSHHHNSNSNSNGNGTGNVNGPGSSSGSGLGADTNTLWGTIVQSSRGLLAALWSLVTVLTFVAFSVAFMFTLYARDYNKDQAQAAQYNNDDEQQKYDIVKAVTSRAMAFSALWTVVMASILSVYGTVMLGFQSPTGQYYTCCASNVHRTTPLGLGSFIGALFMFSNLTLVCFVLFGEYEIRDSSLQAAAADEQEASLQESVEIYSTAFSITCLFLTLLYAGFAVTLYALSSTLLEESNGSSENNHNVPTPFHHRNSSRTSNQINAYNSKSHHQSHSYSGYIGDNRFDVHPSPQTFGTGQGSTDSGLLT